MLYSLSNIDSVEYVVATLMKLPENEPSEDSAIATCRVHLYFLDVVTLGLLWHGFYHATKEGDGERVLRYWEVFISTMQGN